MLSPHVFTIVSTFLTVVQEIQVILSDTESASALENENNTKQMKEMKRHGQDRAKVESQD